MDIMVKYIALLKKKIPCRVKENVVFNRAKYSKSF